MSERFIAFENREDFLGAFAPFMLVALLIFWIAVLILGYGFMFYALREQIRPIPGLGAAIYFAGTSLLTVGYGDIAPVGAAARFLSICAGASGLGAFAIITAFLFAIFGAYQQRESFVVMFSNRAGLPPSGVHLLESFASRRIGSHKSSKRISPIRSSCTSARRTTKSPGLRRSARSSMRPRSP
jgi:hypothetical protein